MKNILLSLLALTFLSNGLTAQVFNTGLTLRGGEISIGINPAYYNTASGNLGLYLHGGYGISKKLDIAFKYGLFDGANYIGGDLEYNVLKKGNIHFSVSSGLHGWKGISIGADFTGNITFQVNKMEFYSGLDLDVDFIKTSADRVPNTKIWLPIGFNTNIMDKLELILEADIAINNNATSIFGGGLVVYLN